MAEHGHWTLGWRNRGQPVEHRVSAADIDIYAGVPMHQVRLLTGVRVLNCCEDLSTLFARTCTSNSLRVRPWLIAGASLVLERCSPPRPRPLRRAVWLTRPCFPCGHPHSLADGLLSEDQPRQAAYDTGAEPLTDGVVPFADVEPPSNLIPDHTLRFLPNVGHYYREPGSADRLWHAIRAWLLDEGAAGFSML